MSDRRIYTALLDLLHIGLWGKGGLRIEHPLSGVEWDCLFELARQQTVEGIVYDGLRKLPACEQPPRPLMLKWTVRVDQIERYNNKMNKCIREQLNFFHHHGIHPILLKGQGIASFYPIPDHRVCGDVDWAFKNRADFRDANVLIERYKQKVETSAGFSTAYLWGGVTVEHHRRVFDIHNPFCSRYLNRLKEAFEAKSMQMKIDGNDVKLLAPLLFVLQLNAHILKHMLSFGVGLRQLCDSAIAYSALCSKLDGAYLREVYKKLGVLGWVQALHATLVKHIGLPNECLPFPTPHNVEGDWFMDDIWRAGNFGFYDTRFADGESSTGSRQKKARRLVSSMQKHLKYAPMEALSFPIVHFYSGLTNK